MGSIVCPLTSHIRGLVNGGLDERSNEDCLYLNVFVPEAERGEKLPVLVWIHGGGYTGGEIEHLTVSESH